MTTVYKYPIPITDEQTVMIPNGYEILHVGLDPNDMPCIWALVDTERSLCADTIYIVGTGQPLPKHVKPKHIGSLVDDSFVWHVFLDKIS